MMVIRIRMMGRAVVLCVTRSVLVKREVLPCLWMLTGRGHRLDYHGPVSTTHSVATHQRITFPLSGGSVLTAVKSEINLLLLSNLSRGTEALYKGHRSVHSHSRTLFTRAFGTKLIRIPNASMCMWLAISTCFRFAYCCW